MTATTTNHPYVDRVIRSLESSAENLGGWDAITVESRPFSPGREFVTIRAERHAGTLASTSVQVFVRTSGPHRAKFLGGSVMRMFSPPVNIRTWRDLRVRGW